MGEKGGNFSIFKDRRDENIAKIPGNGGINNINYQQNHKIGINGIKNTKISLNIAKSDKN